MLVAALWHANTCLIELRGITVAWLGLLTR
jgi:hypothetical protein